MRPNDKPPTAEERAERLLMQDRWRREAHGVTMEGAAERALELAKMPPRPPAFEQAATGTDQIKKPRKSAIPKPL